MIGIPGKHAYSCKLRRAGLCSLLLAVAAPVFAEPPSLTLMSFNLWGAGANAGKPVDETLAVLRAVNPDIAGLQETRAEFDPCDADHCPPDGPSATPALAAALSLFGQDLPGENAAAWSSAVLSRFPITGVSPLGLGVMLEVNGHRVAVFNLHPTDYPYQPYQLSGIPYGDAPPLAGAESAVAAARAARGEVLDLLEQELDWAAGSDAQIVFGDFNEPSFRDWTAATVAAGHHPLPVEWPLTRAIEDLGFVDVLRAAWPDPVQKPAYTWTPTAAPDDPLEHHDRIDFIFVRGPLIVEQAGVVGEAAPQADLVVTPWPSDHRAVMAVVRFEEP